MDTIIVAIVAGIIIEGISLLIKNRKKDNICIIRIKK